MKKIIFVDDEPNILDGLKRMLRSMRKQYKMFFAASGVEALEIMSQESIDVVVSDMRMPGMDGAELLSQIQQEYPHTIRVMLTGQADEQSVMRTVGVVHQFLAKPCDPDELKQVLLKTSALQDLLNDGALKNIVSKIGSLPSLPSTFAQLQSAIADPEVSIDHVAEIVEKDVAMCAKVMQLVNSSFFGLFTHVETPARAVSLLGLDTLKGLVLGVGVFSTIEIPKGLQQLSNLFAHSLLVGQIARKIGESETEDQRMIGDCFIGGILHDIGKLVFISNLPDRYQEVLEAANNNKLTLSAAEKQLLGSSHMEIGGYLAGLWGFNSTVVEAIAFSHQLRHYPTTAFTPAMAVHAADALYNTYKSEEVVGAGHPLESSLISTMMGEERLSVWETICSEFFEQLEE